MRTFRAFITGVILGVIAGAAGTVIVLRNLGTITISVSHPSEASAGSVSPAPAPAPPAAPATPSQ